MFRWLRPPVVALLAALALLSGCGTSSLDTADQAARGGRPAATVGQDSAEQVRAKARELARSGRYAAAVAALSAAGLDKDADHLERRGARALLRSARHALNGQHFARARRLASESRKLR